MSLRHGGVMDRDLAAILDALVGDLRAMDAVGAIELAEWPAAARLVGWVERRPTQGARKLTVADVEQIAETIEYRRARFAEPFVRSVGVVLMNYGARWTEVECVGGEWSGTKADLIGQGGGIPLCPAGHPLIEVGGRKVLALIDDEAPEAP